MDIKVTLICLIILSILSAIRESAGCNKWNTSLSDCGSITLDIGDCTTYNETCDIRYQTFCPYSFHFDQPIMISHDGRPQFILKLNSCSMLNDAMCGQLNRGGLLCSECINDSYGIAMYSRTWRCEKCHQKLEGLMWVLYFLLELTPLTVFFIFVILFNTRVTLPPFTAYVFYCQYFGNVFKTNHLNFRMYLINNINPYVYKLVFTVLDVWSLDFMRLIIPPFCVSSSLTNTHALALQLIPAFYPIFLILFTFILIELHSRNVCVVVQLWRPFNRCVAKVRRSYDPKASIFNAFSTFILLSSAKIIFIGDRFFASVTINTFLNNSVSNTALHVSLINPNEKISDSTLFPYAVSLTILWMLFFFSFFLLLCLYPVKIVRKVLHRIYCKNLHYVKSFVDTFQGYHKDGTNGTYDYRALAGLPLLWICVFNKFIIGQNGRHILAYDNIILMTMSSIYFVVQPCKKNYMNIIEGTLYHIATICTNLITTFDMQHSEYYFIGVFYFTLFLMLFPSLILSTLFIFKLAIKIPVIKVFLAFVKKRLFKHKEPVENNLPHRLTSPNAYTPLI